MLTQVHKLHRSSHQEVLCERLLRNICNVDNKVKTMRFPRADALQQKRLYDRYLTVNIVTLTIF